MWDKIRFVPEGNLDRVLLNIIFKIPEKLLNPPVQGIDRVAKAMEVELRSFNKIVVGLIDNDKRKPPYFKNFITIEEESNIIFKHKENTNQYLIILCPELEEWILNSAKSIGIAIPKEIPENPKKLHNITQLKSVATNKVLMDFLREIKNTKAHSFQKLKEIIDELMNKAK